MKLNQERRWWLRKWSDRGWSIGDPMRCSVKKWRAHTDALVKMGLLESADDDGPYCRMTDAGRRALSNEAES